MSGKISSGIWRRVVLAAAFLVPVSGIATAAQQPDEVGNQVIDWNQAFVDALIATGTANSSSQRLGAIVHTAIFDAYNGIERRYRPIYVTTTAPRGASRQAAVVAAAYKTLSTLFPSQQEALDRRYAASLATLSDDAEGEGDGGVSPLLRGLSWGTDVAQMVLDWRATDGFNVSYPPFTGGDAIGQWRPTPPAFLPMSAQGLAFTDPFIVTSTAQFQPPSPRGLTSAKYSDDYNAVKLLGRGTESTRSDEQTALALFWDGNASVHWNQAANEIARHNGLSLSAANRLFAVLNLAMADTAFTTWSAKRFYGGLSGEVTWRPVTAIPLADLDYNPDTAADPTWLPLINTPAHPEYPSGHASLNGAAATVLRASFDDAQTFTLTTLGQPSRTYTSISNARRDGNDARVWGGMHYPETIAVSDAEGEAVASYVDLKFTRPRE